MGNSYVNILVYTYLNIYIYIYIKGVAGKPDVSERKLWETVP